MKNVLPKKELNKVTANMDQKIRLWINVNRETGSSNWLGAEPVKEYNYILNKHSSGTTYG